MSIWLLKFNYIFLKNPDNMNYVIKKMTTSFGNLKKFLHL